MNLSEKIKQQIPITAYLQQCGYHLERHGSHRLRTGEHDSLIIDPEKNRFWWNSRGKDAGGSVIDLCMALENVSAEEAIRHLAATLPDYPGCNEQNRLEEKTNMLSAPSAPKSQAAFVLPKEDKHAWRRLYAYLLQGRCIDKRVVKWLVQNRLVYPDERGNLVYLSGQKEQPPNYAAKKSMASQSHFRMVVEGSNCNARAAWCMPGAKGWFICEAAVDAWSIMSILAQRGEDFTQYGFLSLEGCFVAPLQYHLAHQPPPTCIWLAQDNDEGGNNSRADAKALLQKAGYNGKIIDCVPPFGKDWNDTLKHRKGGTQHD